MQIRKSDKEGAILILDRDPKDLVSAKSILMEDFDIFIAASAEAAEPLTRLRMPDMILLSLEMAEEMQPVLKAQETPVIYMGEADPARELAAYRLGGIGYLAKPLRPELARQQVQTLYHLVSTIGQLRKSLRRETLLRQSIDVFSHDFGGIRILVAEDVQFNQLILANMLTHHQIEADFADDGRMAVDLFSDAPDAYAAILMDIQMPTMDGITATRIIRGMDTAQSRTIPIIALTASVTPEDMRSYKRLGMSAILPKPVDPELLLSTLIELIPRETG